MAKYFVSQIDTSAPSWTSRASSLVEDSEDEFLISPSSKRKKQISDEDTEEDKVGETSTPISVIMPLYKQIQSSEKPLPDPFPLPHNFRTDVEVALKTGEMTRETTKSFFSTVAGSILTFKRYPTKEEFIRIATDIVRKYPFLRSSTGSPTVSDFIVFIIGGIPH